MKVKQGFYWHVHHAILLEYCYDYEERANYIKKNKAEHEVETRLRLFKPVKGKLPKDLIDALRKYYEAGRKYVEARQKWDEAWRRYDEAERKCYEILEKHKPFIEKLHEKECGCKEWNGEEIVFNKQKS